MIGSIWLEGDGFQQLAPLVEAAEILHIGQKATFGLGLVRGEWGFTSECGP
jgi:CRISPR/Cas system endoribonuclease Cas6 (RAMP superfamily)